MSEPLVRLSAFDDQIAMEKGRLLAAKALAENPDQRKRTEEQFGIEYCKKRWPEAYSPSPFFRRLIDRIKNGRLRVDGGHL